MDRPSTFLTLKDGFVFDHFLHAGYHAIGYDDCVTILDERLKLVKTIPDHRLIAGHRWQVTQETFLDTHYQCRVCGLRLQSNKSYESVSRCDNDLELAYEIHEG